MPFRPLSADEKILLKASDVLDSHCRALAMELDNIATVLENFVLANDESSHEILEKAIKAIKIAKR